MFFPFRLEKGLNCRMERERNARVLILLPPSRKNLAAAKGKKEEGEPIKAHRRSCKEKEEKPPLIMLSVALRRGKGGWGEGWGWRGRRELNA